MKHLSKNFWLFFIAVFVALAIISMPVYLRAKEEVKDPVCGMKLAKEEAKFKSEYKGETYYFCSQDCKDKFDKNPEKYIKKEESKKGMECPGMKMMHMEKHEHEKKEGCCKEMMKDVKVETTNLPDGVQIKITSDNPEVVKKIQEMHKEGKGMGCPMMMKHEKGKEVKKEEHKH
ncbi:MAG: YHS domain-containing protein [Acidobacteriota bacterium]